jgi:hypothetical protein
MRAIEEWTWRYSGSQADGGQVRRLRMWLQIEEKRDLDEVRCGGEIGSGVHMTPRQKLEKFFAKYDPGVAALAKKVLAKMRKLVPGANETVYDNYTALVIGFVPGERPPDVVFSIALYPSYANLFFLLTGKDCQIWESGCRARGSRCGPSDWATPPRWMSRKFGS